MDILVRIMPSHFLIFLQTWWIWGLDSCLFSSHCRQGIFWRWLNSNCSLRGPNIQAKPVFFKVSFNVSCQAIFAYVTLGRQTQFHCLVWFSIIRSCWLLTGYCLWLTAEKMSEYISYFMRYSTRAVYILFFNQGPFEFGNNFHTVAWGLETCPSWILCGLSMPKNSFWREPH